MRKFKILSIVFFLITGFFTYSFADEWTRVEKFEPGTGIFSLRIFEAGFNADYSVTRKTNLLVLIRGNENMEVNVNGLASVKNYIFNRELSYKNYVENQNEILFDDSAMTVEEKIDARIYDKTSSYESFVNSLNDGFKIFRSENQSYKLYTKSFDSELNCTLEKTYLFELLILNQEDFIDSSVTPSQEDLRWKSAGGFKPESGIYNIKIEISGTDLETGIFAQSDMNGILIIKGNNSYSKVTCEMKEGSMLMKYDPIRYTDAKTLYKMAYGNAYSYDDEKYSISGKLDSESLESFNSVMTYKEFLEMGKGEVYVDDDGKYKLIITDSEKKPIESLMTVFIERR